MISLHATPMNSPTFNYIVSILSTPILQVITISITLSVVVISLLLLVYLSDTEGATKKRGKTPTNNIRIITGGACGGNGGDKDRSGNGSKNNRPGSNGSRNNTPRNSVPGNNAPGNNPPGNNAPNIDINNNSNNIPNNNLTNPPRSNN